MKLSKKVLMSDSEDDDEDYSNVEPLVSGYEVKPSLPFKPAGSQVAPGRLEEEPAVDPGSRVADFEDNERDAIDLEPLRPSRKKKRVRFEGEQEAQSLDDFIGSATESDSDGSGTPSDPDWSHEDFADGSSGDVPEITLSVNTDFDPQFLTPVRSLVVQEGSTEQDPPGRRFHVVQDPAQ